MQINRQSIAALKMCITRENGKLARQVIKLDPHHGESGCGYQTIAESNPNGATLAPTLQLKVAKPTRQHHLRFASFALPPQHRQRN
jgi:hypothetical protein